MNDHSSSSGRTGLQYGPFIRGKTLFRVRERHIVDHLIPLMRKNAVGAAKLDLVLRGVALSPQHVRGREPGFVKPSYSWAELHDLCCPTSGDPFALEPSERRRRQRWTSAQLGRLEQLNLLKRTPRVGKRPNLLVMRDDGTGAPFDDPDGSGEDAYITICAHLIASRAFASWAAPELTAYLAAMLAERWIPKAQRTEDPGTRQWYRPLAWFADADRYGPTGRRSVPFAPSTLEAGFDRLVEAGLIDRKKVTVNPRSHARFEGPRNLYTNRFRDAAAESKGLTEDELLADLEDDDGPDSR